VTNIEAPRFVFAVVNVWFLTGVTLAVYKDTLYRITLILNLCHSRLSGKLITPR